MISDERGPAETPIRFVDFITVLRDDARRNREKWRFL